MATYQNLPGVNLELLDGNLRVDNTSDARRVLVIGRSTTGKSNRLYTVRDTNQAVNAHGAGTPLIRKMSEAILGGATQVQLYRIGGRAASLDGIFGEGTYIRTVEESVTAADNIRLYIGPRPSNDGKSCLIAFKGKNIIYSNVPGSEVNRNQIEVVGFDYDTDLVLGTPTEPVLFSNIIPTAKPRTVTSRGNGSTSDYTLTGATKTDAVSDVVVKVNGVEKASGTDYTAKLDKAANHHYVSFTAPVPAGERIQIKYSVKPTGNESGSAVFSGDGTTVKFNLPGTRAADDLELTKVTVANVDELTNTTLGNSDDGLQKAITLTTAPGAQKTVLVEYILKKTPVHVPGKFVEGEDNIDTTWKRYFELLHSALLDLETVNSFSIVTDSAIIDAPNIADGSTAEDRLEYVYVYEEDGEVKYDWSDTKILYRKGTTTTKDVAEADLNGNGQPIVARRYHEANFAYLLANFAHTISENEDFVLATIGASLPTSLTTFEVNKWIGTPATKDSAGNIVTNGTGLLGLRNMVERADTRQGFYKTDSGFVDGDIIYDSNGAPVDIGKYLSVVPQVIVTQASASSGTTAGVTNGAAVYAGLLTTIQPGNSTTNTIVNRISLPGEIKKVKLDQLAGSGYVMFTTRDGQVRVVSGELATNINSDYDYVSTTIIVAETINRVRKVCLPFIGRGLTEATLVALDTAIESELQKLADSDVIVNFAHVVNQRQVVNGKGVLDVALTIVPAFELREVNVSLKLALEV